MKKKIITLMLASALVISIAACGGSKPEATDNKEVVEETEETSEEGLFDEFVGKPLTELMAKVEETEYTASFFADGVDFTSFIDSLKEDYLVGGITEDTEAKTIEVDLLLASNAEHDEMTAALEEKLEVYYAWVAAEKYGQDQYGEDFELHYMIGKIEEYAEDENTWFLKAECSVDGVKMTCEAKVTGTTEAPEVLAFDVY